LIGQLERAGRIVDAANGAISLLNQRVIMSAAVNPEPRLTTAAFLIAEALARIYPSQVKGERLALASVLTWGPGFYTQKLNFTGADSPLSTRDALMPYDLEVSGFPSSHGGHLVMLGMKAMDYPGTTRIEQWPSSNAPVLRWGRSQDALNGYAHSGLGLWSGSNEIPYMDIPPFDSIGANDFIATLPEGLVDFMNIANPPPATELTIWRHTLNVGLRARIGDSRDVRVELVVNGRAVDQRRVRADGSVRAVTFDYRPPSSCWAAVRVLGAAHTNPIWISIGDQPIRVRRSAKWRRKSVDQCWSQKNGADTRGRIARGSRAL